MESEKVKEIKKALEQQGNCGIAYAVNNNKKNPCNFINYADILTLINELESENERLLDQRNKTYNIWVKDTEKLKDRIAELEKEKERLANVAPYQVVISDDKFEELKKNAIEDFNLTKIMLKQFAKRLKENVYDSFGDKVIWYDDIDETLKEFLDD